MTSAYCLVAHGSRDPRSSLALSRLTQAVAQNLLVSRRSPVLVGGGAPEVIQPCIGSAQLECQDQPLWEQLRDQARAWQGSGVRTVKIFPLFLGPGVHMMADLPHQVHLAQQALGSRYGLTLMPHLGRSPQLIPWLKARFRRLGPVCAHRVLVAHGSRYPGSNQEIGQLAQAIAAGSAFWKTEPFLSQILESLDRIDPHRPILIQPYFLFAGGLSDNLKYWVEQSPWAERIHLGDPLGTDLSPLIAARLRPDC